MLSKRENRKKVHKKIRMKIAGTKDRPRLCVFKSAKHIYAQLINDQVNKVLASASDVKIKKGSKSERAIEVGRLIAKESLEKNINKVVFDRGGFAFQGRIKALAESARKAGLKF